MREINKTVRDLVDYVESLGELGVQLEPTKQNQLNEILKSVLILLVALKKSSHLGQTSINFIDE